MRLGISSYTFTWAMGVPGHLPEQPMSALDLLERAHQLGVGVVQIADNLPLHKLAEAEIDMLMQRAQELNITFEIGTRGIAYDHLMTYLGLAKRLGASIVRTIAGTPNHNPNVTEIVETLRPALTEFERHQITLAIENHDSISAPDLRNVVEQLRSPHVGICLDTVNSFGALEGPEIVIQTLAPYVMNLHIKDFVIYRANHMMGFTIEGAPAGKGRLNVPSLLDLLSKRRRDFNAILELWTPPEVDLNATIAKEAAWSAESIVYLRQYIPT
jgi:3-oxoisoapionate decarboxylase